MLGDNEQANDVVAEAMAAVYRNWAVAATMAGARWRLGVGSACLCVLVFGQRQYFCCAERFKVQEKLSLSQNN